MYCAIIACGHGSGKNLPSRRLDYRNKEPVQNDVSLTYNSVVNWRKYTGWSPAYGQEHLTSALRWVVMKWRLANKKKQSWANKCSILNTMDISHDVTF